MGKDDSLIKLKMQDIEKEVDKLTASISEIKRYLIEDKVDSTEQRVADHELINSLSPSSRQASDYKLLGRRRVIFALRYAGYSQDDIAEKLDIAQSTISRILAGHKFSRPTRKRFIKLRGCSNG